MKNPSALALACAAIAGLVYVGMVACSGETECSKLDENKCNANTTDCKWYKNRAGEDTKDICGPKTVSITECDKLDNEKICMADGYISKPCLWNGSTCGDAPSYTQCTDLKSQGETACNGAPAVSPNAKFGCRWNAAATDCFARVEEESKCVDIQADDKRCLTPEIAMANDRGCHWDGSACQKLECKYLIQGDCPNTLKPAPNMKAAAAPLGCVWDDKSAINVCVAIAKTCAEVQDATTERCAVIGIASTQACKFNGNACEEKVKTACNEFTVDTECNGVTTIGHGCVWNSAANGGNGTCFAKVENTAGCGVDIGAEEERCLTAKIVKGDLNCAWDGAACVDSAMGECAAYDTKQALCAAVKGLVKAPHGCAYNAGKNKCFTKVASDDKCYTIGTEEDQCKTAGIASTGSCLWYGGVCREKFNDCAAVKKPDGSAPDAPAICEMVGIVKGKVGVCKLNANACVGVAACGDIVGEDACKSIGGTPDASLGEAVKFAAAPRGCLWAQVGAAAAACLTRVENCAALEVAHRGDGDWCVVADLTDEQQGAKKCALDDGECKFAP